MLVCLRLKHLFLIFFSSLYKPNWNLKQAFIVKNYEEWGGKSIVDDALLKNLEAV